ncbi:MAG: hypothetical protein KKA73_27760 [Chloroflexi bacterium]|nr:hypothetical protein [Chloroflexota bacterium]MBU1751494.1 hypothetical protein [Chloroflexota bacterium]MBU1878495.1 hypothetical protein [Chloroflexota bacterium]
MRDQVLLRRYRVGQRFFREVKVRGGWLGLKPAALAGANLRAVDLRRADLRGPHGGAQRALAGRQGDVPAGSWLPTTTTW